MLENYTEKKSRDRNENMETSAKEFSYDSDSETHGKLLKPFFFPLVHTDHFFHFSDTSWA